MNNNICPYKLYGFACGNTQVINNTEYISKRRNSKVWCNLFLDSLAATGAHITQGTEESINLFHNGELMNINKTYLYCVHVYR